MYFSVMPPALVVSGCSTTPHRRLPRRLAPSSEEDEQEEKPVLVVFARAGKEQAALVGPRPWIGHTGRVGGLG